MVQLAPDRKSKFSLGFLCACSRSSQEKLLSALRCAHCGLVNFATATQCKRCQTPFVQELSATDGSHVQGIVLEDGYVLPPPPVVGTAAGVWRDKGTLIMTKDARLPDRCIKCNEPTQTRLIRKLNWHHPAIYILIFVALLIYAIVAMVTRKRATVEFGICDEHLRKRWRNIAIGWVAVVLGVFGLFLAIAISDGTPALLGLFLLLGGAIFGIIGSRVATPSKIDNHYVWLRGVNKDYLDLLPLWRPVKEKGKRVKGKKGN